MAARPPRRTPDPGTGGEPQATPEQPQREDHMLTLTDLFPDSGAVTRAMNEPLLPIEATG